MSKSSAKKSLVGLGWTEFAVDPSCCTGECPEKHFRVTAWNMGMPRDGGFEFVIGDGMTEASAWDAALHHAASGNYGLSGGFAVPSA